MSSDVHRTRRTFFFELWRSGTAGIIETAGTTFLLLIAVRWFETGALAKAFVAGSGALGLLATPLIVTGVSALGWPSGQAASRLLAIGALGFLLAALWPTLPAFVVGTSIGMASSSAIIPLLTQIYQDNYPKTGRGRLFSKTVMVRIASGAIFAYLAGDFLTGSLERFQALLLVFMAALVFASLCVRQCPSRPISSDGGAHPLRALRYARDDRLFRLTLIAWMLMGFGNLMMMPLRVEYLANPDYNLALTAKRIALLTSVIPNTARLLLSPLWGYLFDHMNFFLLRSLLNLGFILSILCFFLSDSMTGLVIGAVFYGIANSGGEVAWSLWVTKFAEPKRVADYMSVHTFLTGIRGAAAPVCGFSLSVIVGMQPLAWSCSAIILLSTLLLLPEIRAERQLAARAEPKPFEEV